MRSRDGGAANPHGAENSAWKNNPPFSATLPRISENASTVLDDGSICLDVRAWFQQQWPRTILVVERSMNMKLFLDTHNHIEGLTSDAVAQAHEADLKTQGKYDVKYLKYWFDEHSVKAFCLVEA